MAQAAAREEVERQERQREFEMEGIVGAKKVRGKVLHLVRWAGGREVWGAKYQTWEPELPGEVTNAIKIVKRVCIVHFKKGVKLLASIDHFDRRLNKFFVKYTEDPNPDDNEYLDLFGGEKTWSMIE